MNYTGPSVRLVCLAHDGSRFGLFLGVLLLLGEIQFAHANFVTHFWLRENGLPENKVSAVLQTRDGYLWVGTYNGLARFDGVRFVNYDSSNTPEFTDSVVTCLVEARDGTLWIGHETGEVTLLANGKFRPAETAVRWVKKKLLDILEDDAGDIWLCNEDGLLGRARDGLVLSPEPGIAAGLVEITCSPRGAIWIARNGRVSRLHNGAVTPLSFTEARTNTYVEAVGASRDGGVWMLADRRLRKWNDNGWTQDWGEAPSGPAALLKLVECRSGALLGTTSERGLFLIFGEQKFVQFSRRTGFAADWVMDVEEDREGNLWAGTGGNGLAIIHESHVQALAPPDAWQGRAVLSVCLARDQALWAGTEGVGLYRFHDGEWTNFSGAAGLANAYLWSLAQDKSGELWTGSYGGGLYVFRGDHFERPQALDGLTLPMPALRASCKGGLWIGTSEGLLRYDEAGRTNWFGQGGGPNRRDVRCIIENHAGDVWFGTSGEGLFQLRNGVLTQFRRGDGLPSNFIRCLREDEHGALWIGTSDGLCRLRDDHFSAISAKQGLPSNVICDIEDDGLGFFWMSSHNGIFRVSQAELGQCADGRLASVHCLVLGIGDGLPSLEATSGGCRAADGKLWFATCRGLVAVDPKGAKINQLAPPVIIEGLLVDNQPVANLNPSARLNIPPGRHRFEFQYTGLSFVAPEKVRFKHRLDKLDADWNDAGPKRAADYPYLPPGDYNFRVVACNNDGVWNEEGASLSFSVLPFFWQRASFQSFGGLATVLAASAMVWFDTRRRMRRKLELLEHQRAVERERTRIAKDIHDDLGASLTRINLLSQSARRSLNSGQETENNLDRICTTARQLTRAMDEIVWAVDPQHDTLDSLTSYLGKLIHEVLSDSGVRCRLDFPLHLPAWPLTAEVRHNLFLAFKEALHNIVKHSEATEVRVTFALEAAAFTLKVADNGHGFEAAAANAPASSSGQVGPCRNGLANMRQRLQKIGGRCEIQSEQGRGTQITFFLPVGSTSGYGGGR